MKLFVWLKHKIIKDSSVITLLVMSTACASVGHYFDSKGVHVGPGGRCVNLVPENALHPVIACETSSSYEFSVPGQSYHYDKDLFQMNLRQEIVSALQRTAFPKSDLRRLAVDVWTLAPTFSPSDAELVAVVTGAPGYHFAVNLPLDMEKWQVRDEDFVLLGSDAYPSRAARRAGMLLVETKPYAHAHPEILDRWLRNVGIAEPLTSRSVFALKTKVFAESVVAKKLTADTDSTRLLRQVLYVPAGQKEGTKAQSFSFHLIAR